MFQVQGNTATLTMSASRGFRGAISKHRQLDPVTGKHIPGECRIVNNSSLRKLMRAARRGVIPTERKRVMVQAMASALHRLPLYQSGFQRRAIAQARYKAAVPAVHKSNSTKESPAMPDIDNVPTRATASHPEPNKGAPSPIMRRSQTYGVKSNAARAAAKHGLTRSDLFEVEGGWAFNVLSAS